MRLRRGHGRTGGSTGVVAGECIGRAESTAQDLIGTGETDLAGMSITFTVPATRDVHVYAKVPMVGSAAANDIVTVKLTDASNVMKDQSGVRSGTAARNHSTVVLEEVIPAGSGEITRKLRAINASSSNGYTNLAGGGRNVLEAIVR